MNHVHCFHCPRSSSSVYVLLSIYLTCCSLLLSRVSETAEVLRPRGVPLSKKIFYDPGKDFSCLDGSTTVPFHFVNDDYCDCADGSDEPGTAACPNGVFHCTNAGYVERVIPSSRVNDGICDCCDTSDEYNSSAECINNCLELGQQAREEARRQHELLRKGFEVKLEMIKEGKQAKNEARKKVEELQKSKDEAQKVKAEKEEKKKAAEEREKIALEKYQAEEEEKRKQAEEHEIKQHQQMEKKLAAEAFEELDVDKNGLLTVDELQKHNKFDQNRDGIVSEDEAKFFLHMKTEMDKEEFITTGWMIMKPIYMMDKIGEQHKVVESQKEVEDVAAPPEDEAKDDAASATTTGTGTGTVTEEPVEPEAEEEEEEQEEDFEEEEEDYAEPPQFPPKDNPLTNKIPDSSKGETKYDEETQKIIDALFIKRKKQSLAKKKMAKCNTGDADKKCSKAKPSKPPVSRERIEAKEARDEFSEAEANLNRIERELKEAELKVSIDYGPDEEFASLHGQCFDLTDREYTYRLCLFDRATQKSTSGGSETNLGKWGRWIGDEGNKYEGMKYEGGATCWNGPARSVVVQVHCGTENQLTSASEPSRCEYLFDFATPAACSQPPPPENMYEHLHVEL